MKSRINILAAFLFMAMFCPRSLMSQGTEVDIDLINENLNLIISRRLNNFPKPYVKRALNAYQRSMIKVEVITEEEYAKLGVYTNPFIKGRTVFIALTPDAQSGEYGVKTKVISLVDRGDPFHEPMLKGLDMILIATDLIIEKVGYGKLPVLMKEIEEMAEIQHEADRQKKVSAIFDKHVGSGLNKALFSAQFTFGFLSRYKDIYPDASLENIEDAMEIFMSTKTKTYLGSLFLKIFP